MMTERWSLNYGGGVQSTALLVLAAQGRIRCDLAVFANVGDDSEHPATLAYLRDVARPYADAHGIELVEATATIGGATDTILQKIERTPKSEVIPVRSRADGPPLSRSCTVSFKIEVIGRVLTARGASAGQPWNVMLGISSDEATRAGRKAQPWERLAYPLLGIPTLPDGWTRPLNRSDCEGIIRRAGIPVPPKSSCWFCPFTRLSRWQDLKRRHPDLFDRACHLEDQLTAKSGKPRYLTRFGRPLRDVVDDDQLLLFDLDSHGEAYSCTGGMCAS